MIRDEDVNWQFWRKCYCALDRELNFILELKPGIIDNRFSLTIILNLTSADHKSITKERIAFKSYPIETVKLDIKKEYRKYIDMFFEDYFATKDMGCRSYKGMIIC